MSVVATSTSQFNMLTRCVLSVGSQSDADSHLICPSSIVIDRQLTNMAIDNLAHPFG